MADYTYTAYANQGAGVSKSQPDTNFHTQEVFDLSDFESYFSFAIPNDARGKAIWKVDIKLYAKGAPIYLNGQPNSVQLTAVPLLGEFDETTLTDVNGNPGCDNRRNVNPYINLKDAQYGWRTIPISSYNAMPEGYLAEIITNGIMVYMPYTAGAGTSGVHSKPSVNYKPYITIYAVDPEMSVIDCRPSGGFVNESAANTFYWNTTFAGGYIMDAMTQASAKFRWRPDAGSAYTEIEISGATKSYTLPSGTIATDSMQWQVEVTATNGDVKTSEWFTLSTIDSLSTCQNLDPRDAYIVGSDINRFSWEHTVDTGTQQTAYELQYSVDDESWIALASATSANQYVDIPANTLPAGRVRWKVRTKNTDGADGAWSDAVSFICQAAPDAPSFASIDSDKARPTIAWSSVGQQAFELAVTGVYATGEVASTKRTHRVNEYLAPGTYQVRLRVKNKYGLWSVWTTASVTIAYTVPNAPTVSAVSVAGGVKITASGDFEKYYLLRDDVLIAQFFNEYSDMRTIGIHRYTVRGVTDADLFSDAELTAGTMIDAPQISAVENPVPISMRLRKSPSIGIAGSTSPDGSMMVFSGRKYPVYQFGEHLAEYYQADASYLDEADYQEAIDVLSRGKTLLYRDQNEMMFCVATRIEKSRDFAARTIALTLARVDYAEKIQYGV